jgi:hypothetical protein
MRTAVDDKKRDLSAITTDRDSRNTELLNARRRHEEARSLVSHLDMEYAEAKRRYDDASTRAREYGMQVDQASREYQNEKQRYDQTQRMSADQFANLPPQVRDIMSSSGSGYALRSVAPDDSVVRDKQRNHDELTRTRDSLNAEVLSVKRRQSEAKQKETDAASQVSKLENDVFSLESKLRPIVRSVISPHYIALRVADVMKARAYEFAHRLTGGTTHAQRALWWIDSHDVSSGGSDVCGASFASRATGIVTCYGCHSCGDAHRPVPRS